MGYFPDTITQDPITTQDPVTEDTLPPRPHSPATDDDHPDHTRSGHTAADELTYGRYLQLDDLLSLQHPLSEPLVPDELLFITVHQVFELWLKLLLFELGEARDAMLDGDATAPRVRLQRCQAIERLLVAQFDVLDSMQAPDFVRFRDGLGTASGAQSAQFVEVEILSALRDPDLARRDWLSRGERAMLRRRLAEPCVWDGFLAVLDRAGFDVSTPADRSAAYLAIADDRRTHGALWELQEALIGHDQCWSLWRARHAIAARRQLGAKRGTHGTAGASALRARQSVPFFPELWEMRSLL